MAFFAAGLRRLAVQAPPKFFVCNQCLRQAPRQPANNLFNLVRSRGYASQATAETPLGPLASRMPTGAPAQSRTASQAGKKSFPETSSKSVGYWLVGSAVSVFGIVIFGGLTRLTESGLSITEWRPVTGSLPPMCQEDWDSEFEKYRASPEFKLLNPHMTLSEFKQIYFMEWTHRLWGRFIGMSFVLPTLYFVARRRVSAKMAVNLLGISSLIGFQGFIGWWMVKSGLKDDLFAPGSHPRVSQYRLTAHLGTAFICYSWMLLSGLAVLRTHRFLKNPADAAKLIEGIKNPAIATFRRSVLALTGLVFLTAMSGGLVAGLDAGLIYNDFPWMGGNLTPPSSELWSKFYSRKEDGSDIWWRNMLENPSTVQLDHRIMAMTTFTSVVALFIYSRTGRLAKVLPKNAKAGAHGLLGLVSMQAALGITTLWYMVPISLGAAHQAGALALLTGALVLCHRLHVPKPVVDMVKRRVQDAARAKNHGNKI
ncbi:cytochrome oxidase assembly protein-domain-containing protein [Stachybotrys elegans]|uniref:Cytochrome oxidase assembly protein-domain-containing protein n=1 Tax=Stachybotrys elegans TaxID=80388 RepID=A0A8K0SMF4_9HYPO|nr:cytochrome oxidase assembly protein-domain-containing protein [Stachybotrys elegans]